MSGKIALVAGISMSANTSATNHINCILGQSYYKPNGEPWKGQGKRKKRTK